MQMYASERRSHHSLYSILCWPTAAVLASVLVACSGEQTSTPGTPATVNNDAASESVSSPRETMQPVDSARILAAADNTSDWLTHGRTYAEERNSPLARINRDTVSDLGMAWDFELDTDR